MSLKKILITCAAFFITTLYLPSTSGRAMAEAVNIAAYFPLEAGMEWTYLEDGLNSVTFSVLTSDESLDGNATKAIKQSGGKFSGLIRNFTNDANGLLEYKEFVPHVVIEGVPFQNLSFFFMPPVNHARATVNLGEIISSAGTVNIAFSGFGPFPLTYNATAKFTNLEKITVPMGEVTTIKMLSSLTISGYINGKYFSLLGSSTIWLAKFIGIVKEMSAIGDVHLSRELTGINFQPGSDPTPDKIVDLNDLAAVLKMLTKADSQPVSSEISDINGDGSTGLAEALHVLRAVQQ